MANSPTQRSMSALRNRGYTVRIVEHYNAYSKKRQDLFGFGDILGRKAGETGSLIIQTTTAGNIMARVHKAQQLDAYHLWLLTGNRVEFHGWGKKKNRWECRIIHGEIGIYDLF
jgi:hypothetical protein